MYADQDTQAVGAVWGAEAATRGQFIKRTYLHLLGAILAFVGVEAFLFQSGLAAPIAATMLKGTWLLVLGAFVVVSWIASRVAAEATSLAAQYAALAGYVVAEALIFVPMLLIASTVAPGVIQTAAVVTLTGFAALTIIVFITGTDFSFLGSLLWWGGICAVGLIVACAIFGWNLGTWFSLAMIAFAGSAILYDTTNVMRYYSADRYVSASLQLFASVALLFWYVLRFFMSARD